MPRPFFSEYSLTLTSHSLLNAAANLAIENIESIFNKGWNIYNSLFIESKLGASIK